MVEKNEDLRKLARKEREKAGARAKVEILTHQGILGVAYTYCGLKKEPGILWSNNWEIPKATCPKCLGYQGMGSGFIPEEIRMRLEIRKRLGGRELTPKAR